MRALALALAALLLAGCASSVRTVTRVQRVASHCNGISADLTIRYAICDGHRFVRDGHELEIAAPAGAKIGHWAKAFLSPDGKTLLAQWSAECEVPVSFFVDAGGGEPRPVVGKTLRDAPVSIADGWTADGRAIVELPADACGNAGARPGIYFVALDGARTLVAPLRRSPGSS